jgi:predicted RNA-binding Zn ribbon-like protein
MRYEFVGGNLALDFANTVHSHGMADPGDDLKIAADFVTWASQAGLLRRSEIARLQRASPENARFRRALALREVLYEIFSRTANGKKPRSQALQTLQNFYQSAIRYAQFYPLAGHYRLAWPTTTHPLERVSLEIARSAASLLTSEALTRVRQCSGETCSWLFLDTSRNGLRRWCDMKACGNRAKVQRFRRRGHARQVVSRAHGK